MNNEIDDAFDHSTGVNFCNLALAATLMDAGILKRDDFIDMITVLIDWVSIHQGKTMALPLIELRNWLALTDSHKKMRDVFAETIFPPREDGKL